jgi:hypothetical protein
MPYEVCKLPSSKLYKVRNKETGAIKSSGTTRTDALRQVRLLNAIEKTPQKFIR